MNFTKNNFWLKLGWNVVKVKSSSGSYAPILGTTYICISTIHLNRFLDHLGSKKDSSK